MKKIILSILIATVTQVYGQSTCTSTTNGNWRNGTTWNCTGAPTQTYSEEDIYIDSDVSIANNNDVDLTGSGVKRITIRSNKRLIFDSNAQLLLPGDAEIILEEDAVIEASNNSKGTLIEIGGNGVWGRNCAGCTNDDIVGAGTINGSSAPGSPLPVTFANIQASYVDNQLTVGWSTAMELNNDYFTIEVSHDQEEWKTISTVEGAGNSAEILHYTETVLSDQVIRYVRIKQTDYDGQYAYSDIIGLENKPPAVNIYPNPTSDNIHIDKIPAESNISLYNMNGSIVYNATASATSHTINISQLEKGVYFLHIQHDRFSSKQKIVVK